jgi:hypothetical protein
MSERINRVIAEHGVRVKDLDDERKEVEREIRERETRLRAIDAEREKEVFAIRTLEEALDESERAKSWTAQHRNKKPGDPLSVAVLIEQALENRIDGLRLPALLTEVRKLGFQTDSKDPIGVLTGTLHRRKDLFARPTVGHRGRKDIRWCLKKYVQPTIAIVGTGGTGGSIKNVLGGGELGRAFADAKERAAKKWSTSS